jgi:hypothetical protein
VTARSFPGRILYAPKARKVTAFCPCLTDYRNKNCTMTWGGGGGDIVPPFLTSALDQVVSFKFRQRYLRGGGSG